MTRQKLVHTADNVAHKWAHKLQDEARVAHGNFYFRKDTIFSYGYHFPIAVHFQDKVLFTLRTFSNTTAKHIRTVESATSHMKNSKIYCAYPDKAAYGDHAGNIAWWISNIKHIFPKLAAARKPEIYQAQISREMDQLKKYMAFFKSAKLTSEQKKILKPTEQPDFKEAVIKAEKMELDAEIAKQKQNKSAYLKYIKTWQENGDITALPEKIKERSYYYRSLNMPTVLRPTPDGKQIETSKGVKLPIDVAKRVYINYLEKLKAGGCDGDCGEWKVLDYRVNKVDSKGLVIGCHNIETAEINRIASQMGW